MPKFFSPVYRDYSKYQAQLEKDDNPKAAIFMVADSELLFWREAEVPWLYRVKCELPTRPEVNGIEPPVKASYIGYANDDNEDFYELFVAAMEEIDVFDVMMIHKEPSWKEVHCIIASLQRAHLERSDIIVIGGGNLAMGWKVMEDTMMMEHVKWRYYDGAVVIGVAVGSTYLGQKGWDPDYYKKYREVFTFETINIVPEIITTNSADFLREHILDFGPGKVGIDIPKGGGLIFNRDGTFEPVRKPVSDFHWDYEKEKLIEAIMYPPPRNEGMMVAKNRLLLKEKRMKELGIRTMTKEEFLQYKAQIEAEEEEIEVEVDPVAQRKADYYRDKGTQLFGMRDSKGAEKNYKESLRHVPTQPIVWANLSQVYLRLEQWTDALKAANMSLRHSLGQNAKGWWRRGKAFRAQGDISNALLDCREALQLLPDDASLREQESQWSSEEQEARRIGEQWVRKGEWPEDSIYATLVANTVTELKASAPLDIRGAELWYRCLADPKCSLKIVQLDGYFLGMVGIQRLSRGLAANPSLDTLSLVGCYIRPYGAQCLGHALQQNTSLAELDLSRNGLRDVGVAYIATALEQNSRMMIIRLNENDIGDVGSAKIAKATVHHKSLVEVSLNGNLLSFPSASHWAHTLRANTMLLKVYFDHNAFRVDSLWRLASVAIGHPTLKTLSLRGLKLSATQRSELVEQTKYKMCEVLIGSEADAPSERDYLY